MLICVMMSHPVSNWDKFSHMASSLMYMTKVSFIILRHCCTHCPCWLRTLGGASSLTKTLISQSALCAFASVLTLVTLALCVKCRRTLKGTLVISWINCGLINIINPFNTIQQFVGYLLRHSTDVSSWFCSSNSSFTEGKFFFSPVLFFLYFVVDHYVSSLKRHVQLTQW